MKNEEVELGKTIDNVIAGKYNKQDDVILRDNTPQILVNNGVKCLPMLINQKHLKENILSKNKARKLGVYNKDANYHNLGKEIFIKAIESLDSPLAILKSISPTGKSNSYVIVTNVENNSGN